MPGIDEEMLTEYLLHLNKTITSFPKKGGKCKYFCFVLPMNLHKFLECLVSDFIYGMLYGAALHGT